MNELMTSLRPLRAALDGVNVGHDYSRPWPTLIINLLRKEKQKLGREHEEASRVMFNEFSEISVGEVDRINTRLNGVCAALQVARYLRF